MEHCCAVPVADGIALNAELSVDHIAAPVVGACISKDAEDPLTEADGLEEPFLEWKCHRVERGRKSMLQEPSPVHEPTHAMTAGCEPMLEATAQRR
jgi:hypothetical protein